MVKSLYLFLVLAGAFLTSAAQKTPEEIAEDTRKIVTALCGKVDEQVAKDFYGCYDRAEGKEQFSLCQVKVFGGILNDPFIIVGVCTGGTGGLPEYSNCLYSEFYDAKIDLIKAVTIVNDCQAGVVGIEL